MAFKDQATLARVKPSEPGSPQLSDSKHGVCYLTDKISAELRNAIYEYVVPFHGTLRDPSPSAETQRIHGLKISPTIDMSILRLNKQIYHEARAVFYGCNKFIVFHENMERLSSSPCFGRIRDLDIIHFDTEMTKATIERLQNASSLRMLTFTANGCTSFMDWHSDALKWNDIPAYEVTKAEIGRVECTGWFKSDICVVLQWLPLIVSWKALVNKEAAPHGWDNGEPYHALTRLQRRANHYNRMDPGMAEFFELDPEDGIKKLRLKNRSLTEIANFGFTIGRACFDMCDHVTNWTKLDRDVNGNAWRMKFPVDLNADSDSDDGSVGSDQGSWLGFYEEYLTDSEDEAMAQLYADEMDWTTEESDVDEDEDDGEHLVDSDVVEEAEE